MYVTSSSLAVSHATTVLCSRHHDRALSCTGPPSKDCFYQNLSLRMRRLLARQASRPLIGRQSSGLLRGEGGVGGGLQVVVFVEDVVNVEKAVAVPIRSWYTGRI